MNLNAVKVCTYELCIYVKSVHDRKHQYSFNYFETIFFYNPTEQYKF